MRTEQQKEAADHHGDKTFIRYSRHFAGGFTKAKVICEDGTLRTCRPTPRGEMTGFADTFFSIPAFVYVGKVRVYGYLTSDSNEVGRTVYLFIAYSYRKHHALVEVACGD